MEAKLFSVTKDSGINCQGDSGLNITISLFEYLQRSDKINRGWFKSISDIYTNRIKSIMTELSKQNKPKF